jgi:para-nitrobenzyl esterase
MSTRVEIESGTLEGVQREDHLRFLGIPFAAPPTAERRFLPPQAVAAWSGVREAKEFGRAAPQPPARVMFMNAGVPTDEDCLYLNVYTRSREGRRPVMVWIHGGGFSLGSGSQAAYIGDALCTRGDVVLVSINYRLGMLGYMYLGEHGGERWGSRGNLGQLDQIAALRWVQKNIAAFGGDPNNVTIFGESAGGAAVSALLAMPEASGLFHKAIAQSGTANALPRADKCVPVTAAVLAELGLDASNSEQLQSLPLSQLVKAGQAAEAKLAAAARERGASEPPPDAEPARGGLTPFFPLVDGKTLPQPALSAVAEGSARNVPLIVGTNRDENEFGAALTGSRPPDFDDERLLRRVARVLGRRHGERAAALIDVYRRSRKEARLPHENRDILSAITTDRTQRIPAIRLVEAQRTHQARTYNYLFSWEQPQLKAAIHGLEIGFVFGHVGKGRDPLMQSSGEAAQVLSQQMLGAWTAFARNGDPNLRELAWEPYQAPRRATMVYDTPSALIDAPFEAERAAWDGIA